MEALVVTTDAREQAPQIQFPSTATLGEVRDAVEASEKGYGVNKKDIGMWNGVGKESKTMVSGRSDAEYAHAVRHAASLLGCLVVLYLVVR